MTESLINEWLTDCADFTSLELHTFANTLGQDNEIVRALYNLLEERSKYSELVDTVCNQLFNFYRSREIELQRFTLQFVPTLIFIYLNSVAHGDIKNCRSVETLLIGLYNLEVVDKSGEPKAVSFRLPSLAMLSIYHEPSSLAPASLTESAVRRFEECNTKLVSWGPLQQVETLNAQNRLKVMTALLFIYNQQLSYIHKSALEQFCKVATKLVTQGFTKPGHHQRSSYGSESSFVPRLLPRIPVNNQFLLEFLHGIYFAMYNDCWYVGSQAVEDIHNRACYDGYPDVMLVTNAIRNSSSSGPSGQPGEGSMGISVALSPATATATVSKSMITNASFRTKKLPDDLDETLFDSGDSRSNQEDRETPSGGNVNGKAPQAGSGGSKRRAWLWKHTPHYSLDEEDATGASQQQKSSAPSSLENSRRESLSSAHGSPSRNASPKKSRDAQQSSSKPPRSSGDSPGGILDEVHRRTRKDAGKDRGGSPGNESRLSADDIPIQVVKDEAGGESKANLVSITEEETGVDPSRTGSVRQSREMKDRSKITNFSLGKKPREKEAKSAKNGYVTGEKESKKMSSQSATKENVKGSRSVLNSDQTDGGDATVNGTTLKKNNSVTTNDSSGLSLADLEQQQQQRLNALSGDAIIDNVELETSVNLRTHNDTESLGSSVQVSSV